MLDLEARRVREFWADVEDGTTSLSEGRGCYIFAIKAGRGITPWYVGVSTTGFKRECFQPPKQVIYQKAYNEVRRGKPVLILVARVTEGGRLSRRMLDGREAGFVETTLMHRAWSRNPKLKNVSGLAVARQLKIPGLLNSEPGAPSVGAQLLSTTLGAGPS
ncbi:MAG: hypothetical protein OXL38_01995 [Gammaproteobacteria bacterium]|nr:hypothetical protein [Gammaproteobacteria bacterium]